MLSMEQKAALTFVRSLVDKHGAMTAAAMLAEAAKVSEGTAYGWLRRKSIPEWRLPSVAKLAKRQP